MGFVSKTQLLSYGQDHFLRFWDADSGRQTGQQECRGASLCSSGACAYFLNQDEKIFRWDAATAKASPLDLNIPDGVQGIKANEEGTHLVILQEAVSTGKTLSVWSVAERKELKKVVLTSKYGAHFALNHRADLLAITDQSRVLLSNLKDTEPPRELGSVELHTLADVLAFTPDDNCILVGNSGSDVYQWEIETRRQLPIIKNWGGTVSSITFRNDKEVTIVGGGYVSEFVQDKDAWNLNFRSQVASASTFTNGYNRQAQASYNGGILLTSRGPPPRIAGGTPDGLSAIDFSPDGRWLATGSESGQITLWETGTWKKGLSWKGHTGILRSLRFSHSGKILGALADDGYAVLWDPATGKEIRSIKKWLTKKRLAFSWDDQWLALHVVGKPGASIFDVETGEQVMEDPEYARGEAAFSPDRSVLVATGSNETFHVWDIQKKSVTARLGKQTQSDLDIVFHPDGRRVLTSGTGLSVRVWDLVAQKETLALTDPAGPGRPTGIALSADGKLVAAGFEDGAARIWDLESGLLLKVFQLGPRSGIVDDVSFSPDGGYLATLNRNGTVYILSLDGMTTGK